MNRKLMLVLAITGLARVILIVAGIAGLSWGISTKNEPMSINDEVKELQKKLENIEKKQQMLQKIQDLEREKDQHDGKRASSGKHLHEMN